MPKPRLPSATAHRRQIQSQQPTPLSVAHLLALLLSTSYGRSGGASSPELHQRRAPKGENPTRSPNTRSVIPKRCTTTREPNARIPDRRLAGGENRGDSTKENGENGQSLLFSSKKTRARAQARPHDTPRPNKRHGRPIERAPTADHGARRRRRLNARDESKANPRAK